MGWNTSALFVRDRSAEEVVGSLPDVVEAVPTGASESADQAWSQIPGGRVYLAETAGWTQLWDPELRIPTQIDGWLGFGELAALRGTRALAILFSSVTSSYAFWLYDDARLVRHVLFVNGEREGDYGTELPVEATVAVPSWGPDEDFLWAIVRDVTGLDADLAQQFAVYDIEGP